MLNLTETKLIILKSVHNYKHFISCIHSLVVFVVGSGPDRYYNKDTTSLIKLRAG